MKRAVYVLFICVLLAGLAVSMAGPVSASDKTTIEYGNYAGSANWFSTHFESYFEEGVPVWDLTQGDLVLHYTLDMSQITQPHGLPANPTEWEAYVGATAKDPSNYPDSYTPYIEVGLRGEGADDFNPGPFGVYQGNCGGWMVSECDDWVGYWDGEAFLGDGTQTQDLDDKHGLQASGGRSELDYDVLLSTPDTVDSIPSPYWWYPSPKGAYGSWNNHGLWFDRDGVDQWQATSWGNSGENAGRINTGGVYIIEITYHAIDDGLGVMFAKINGVQQGFYTEWVSGEPQYYPVGLSFKGDMEHMQVFAGSWAGDPSGWNYGMVLLTDISVTGYPGVSDPLIADFDYTFTSDVLSPGDTVNFTDASDGGMPPYSYSWDFGDGETSTDQNPSHVYSEAGEYTVTLTVTPFRCVPRTITKTLSVVETGCVDVVKFYDADADGVKDEGEPELTGWKFSVDGQDYYTPASVELPVGTYAVTEAMPTEGCWMSTTPASVSVELSSTGCVDVEFGNLCLGAGGGLTPGYWSNKNGQKSFAKITGALAALQELNLWKYDKKTRSLEEFNPATYAQFKAWLLARDAVDMRYQLSAHLAAMTLNVMAGYVDGDDLVYGGPDLGFMTVDDLLDQANTALAADSEATREDLGQLKDALDKANNNRSFVQPEPCPFSF